MRIKNLKLIILVCYVIYLSHVTNSESDFALSMDAMECVSAW